MDLPVVRRARESDADAIAAIHREQFASHSVSRLPFHLASRLFAQYVLHKTVLVASRPKNDDEVLAYLVGGRVAVLDRARQRFTLENLRELSLVGLRVAKVSAALRRGRALLLPSRRRPDDDAASWQLRYIAVRSDAKRLGIASALVRAFEASIPDAPGYHAWALSQRPGVLHFYERLAFVPEKRTGAHVLLVRRFCEDRVAVGETKPRMILPSVLR